MTETGIDFSNNKESEVDWDKVEVDTPIFVSQTEEKWFKRYFAKYEHGRVYAWIDGRTSWSADNRYLTSWYYAKLVEED